MADEVSIIVLSTGTNPNEALLPQILLDQKGIWRDVSSPYYRSKVSATEMKDGIDSELNRLMKQVEDGGGFDADAANVKGMAIKYYNYLVPEDVQAALRKAAQSINGDDIPLLRIHVHPSSEWIPWEMLHDGKGFLGMQFQIARLPILSQVRDLNVNQPLQVQSIYSLLANNFLDDQDQKDKWSETFNGLHAPPVFKQIPLSLLPDAVYPKVDQMVNATDADILHVTCHGGMKDKFGTYWTLSDQSPFPGQYNIYQDTLETITFKTRPLVFGNACASSSGGGAQATKNGLMTGFATQFFSKGALNFVGTFSPITKKLAVEFAGQFYKHLLGQPGQPGMPIGKALFRAKQYYYQVEKRADPSYLFYCLYGPPETTFQV
ncbi:MAG TPA: CHAT domain-containing protein [Pyrinomonadaceae bacterium]|jgi:CHAT domain-containing protein